MSDQENEKHEEEALEEGELYVFKKGALEHIQRDPDDNLRKVRITDDAFEKATVVQRSMRRLLNGYKPDITMVISALIETGASDAEKAAEVVKGYAKKMFS